MDSLSFLLMGRTVAFDMGHLSTSLPSDSHGSLPNKEIVDPTSQDQDRRIRNGLHIHHCAVPNTRGLHTHAFPQIIVDLAENTLADRVASSFSTVSIYPADTPHLTKGAGQVIFDLETEVLSAAADDLGARGAITLNKYSGSDPAIEQLARLAQSEVLGDHQESHFYLESICHVLLSHLIRVHTIRNLNDNRHRGFSDVEMLKIKDLIDQHMESGFTIGVLAEYLGCRPQVFVERLRLATGLRPWQFVQERKVNTAKRLLARRSLSIAEIAAITGFTDQSHFSNAFRRLTGSTPGSYRKSL
jgi:AraC family transcriptional regulator